MNATNKHLVVEDATAGSDPTERPVLTTIIEVLCLLSILQCLLPLNSGIVAEAFRRVGVKLAVNMHDCKHRH